MPSKSVRKRLLAGLEKVKAHVAAGDKAAARAVLANLRNLANEGDPKGASRLRAVLDVHDARVAAMPDVTSAKSEPVRQLPDNATCSLCRTPFHRDDPKENVCDICRPPDRRSVRTVSGGAPGLGKRK